MNTTRKETIGIDSVSPGSILAEAVLDANGKTLLPAGAAISESHLFSLRRRDIEALCILLPVEVDAKATAAAMARIEAKLDHLFRQSGDNPIARDIKQRVLDFHRNRS
jgi:hypothetical protein